MFVFKVNINLIFYLLIALGDCFLFILGGG